MGTVIKFPQVRGPENIGQHEAPARPAGASADIIILPVVRIERMLEVPPEVKAAAAKSVSAKSVSAKSVPAKSLAAQSVAARSAMGKPVAKSASTRKRRKRVAPALPTPAWGRG